MPAMSLRTLADLFQLVVQHTKKECLLHKVDGDWVSLSSRDLGDRVRRLISVLDGLGVGPGDRVALMAENGPHWPTVDFATLSTGAVLVPIYPTLTPDQAAFIANDCEAKVVFVQGGERLDGLLAERATLPKVERFVLIDGTSPDPQLIPTLGKLLEATAPIDPGDAERRIQAVGPDDPATFIYTSGTTGRPKGVMLSHGNVTSNVLASAQCMAVDAHQTALSFLPLSHSFERTVDYIYFYRGVTIAYAESVQAVSQNLLEIRPHMFVSVPRVYEKVLAKVLENVARSSAAKQRIFEWARGVGKRAVPYRLQRKRPPGTLGLELALADKLVFAKIRERLGGRFEFAISGGAPLGPDVAEFFWGAGIEIYEGYGLSETSPVLTVNSPGKARLGTVGQAIPGVELRIAADGEILARGPNIMRGYFNLPEASEEAIDAEGWFHTGDIGQIDDEGYLRITDRKKEILVNAYGKNIAPAPIENALKASRYIEQAVLIGDRRKFLSALLVPDFEALRVWAEGQGIEETEPERLARDYRVRELLLGEVRAVNAHLAHYEHVQAWEILAAPFTIETGELTPTQKVKRRVIVEKYAKVIDGLYRAAEGATVGA
jgi:long-chain acyl-CoA synthetase